MKARTRHLKIKVLSLAAEARIIRREAKKTKGDERWDLNHHRTQVVRDHTRHNQLAYGMLIGVSYEDMERTCQTSPNFDRVRKIAKSFGADEEFISRWIRKAKGEKEQKVA